MLNGLLSKEITESHQRLSSTYAEFTELVARCGLEPGVPADRPFADRKTGTIYWRGCSCHLGHTLRFRFFARLVVRPNHYVTYHQLRQDVWNGNLRSREGVRSVVRHLKKALRLAKMGELANAISGHDQRYVLGLDE